MKTLVTGGAGFIGSHLVDALINSGESVVIVDNLASCGKGHINPGAKFYNASICDQQFQDIMEDEKPELVYHLAAQTSVGKSVTDPVFDAQVNILGSLNVISGCLKTKVNKLVFASSSATYGHPKYLPVDEDHPANPLAPYGVSKHTVEHYLLVHHHLHGLPYTALRFANVYGPRQNPLGEGGVIAIFTKKMLSGSKPTIFGDGSKTRDYVYVSDVISAILAAGRYNSSDVFNIGTGIETNDLTVFKSISRACGYDSGYELATDRPGDIKHLYLNCLKANNLLNWSPQISLEDGISHTVAYQKGVN